jgi:hypothetical protein
MLIYPYKTRYFVDFLLASLSVLASFFDSLFGAKNNYHLKYLKHPASQSEGEPKREVLPRGRY